MNFGTYFHDFIIKHPRKAGTAFAMIKAGMNPIKQRDFMKAILLTLITATLFYSAFQTDRIKVTGIFQGNVFDRLDPSWPKLA